MILIKKGLNSLGTLKPLYQLYNNCIKVDGYSLKLYWHLLEERLQDNKNYEDYLAYVNNRLVGSLHIHAFLDSVEIAAMVSPEYRNKDIFKKMLAKAIRYLSSHNILQVVLICNEKDISLSLHLVNWGGNLKHVISQWRAPPDISTNEKDPLIIIERAQVIDIDIFVNINHLCFPQTLNSNLHQRFIKNLQEGHREIYIAKNRDQQVIGKLHIREEQKQIVIHEFGIVPTFQRKGFGLSLIKNWLKKYAERYDDKPIFIEVFDHNNAAISLYKSCGFIKQNTFNYYEFFLVDLYEING